MRKRPLKGRKPTCSNCGAEKEPSRKKYAYCKFCHAEHMRMNRIVQKMALALKLVK
jgi:hypothetical protein